MLYLACRRRPNRAGQIWALWFLHAGTESTDGSQKLDLKQTRRHKRQCDSSCNECLKCDLHPSLKLWWATLYSDTEEEEEQSLLGSSVGQEETFDEAFFLQRLHGRPSADELLQPVLHAALVGAVRAAVLQLGAAEHVCRRTRHHTCGNVTTR